MTYRCSSWQQLFFHDGPLWSDWEAHFNFRLKFLGDLPNRCTHCTLWVWYLKLSWSGGWTDPSIFHCKFKALSKILCWIPGLAEIFPQGCEGSSQILIGRSWFRTLYGSFLSQFAHMRRLWNSCPWKIRQCVSWRSHHRLVAEWNPARKYSQSYNSFLHRRPWLNHI